MAYKAFANISSATTDGPVVAAKPGFRINVLGVAIVAGGTATDVTFTSKPGGAGAAISAKFALGSNGVMVLPESLEGWFTTVKAQGLSVTTGTGSAVGVQVIYDLDPYES